MNTGCFGSVLAYNEKCERCDVCPWRKKCSASIERRRPTFIELLDKFLNGKGDPMSLAWLTRSERKERKDQEHEEYLSQLFGSIDKYRNLTRNLDTVARAHIDKLAKHQIDITRDGIPAIIMADRALGLVLNELSHRRLKILDVTTLITLNCDVKPSTARREARAIMRALVAANRARYTKPFWEII